MELPRPLIRSNSGNLLSRLRAPSLERLRQVRDNCLQKPKLTKLGYGLRRPLLIVTMCSVLDCCIMTSTYAKTCHLVTHVVPCMLHNDQPWC
jgi:hypothetical protein